MLCAKCSNDNPADASFCEGCGAKLELVCPTCKTLASPGARFCKKCGTALAATRPDSHPVRPSEPPIRVTADAGSAPDAIDGERKTVTALFADIKGSTELMEDLEPEEARAIIDPALKLMIDAVHRYDGYVVQSTSDGSGCSQGLSNSFMRQYVRRNLTPVRLTRSFRFLKGGVFGGYHNVSKMYLPFYPQRVFHAVSTIVTMK
jgi:Double zinc ribbon